jgi:hypothetical protein
MKAGIHSGVSVWAAYAAAEMVMLLLAPLVSGQNHIVLRRFRIPSRRRRCPCRSFLTPWLERFARTATVYRNAFAVS